jgi:cell division septation protein DedD
MRAQVSLPALLVRVGKHDARSGAQPAWEHQIRRSKRWCPASALESVSAGRGPTGLPILAPESGVVRPIREKVVRDFCSPAAIAALAPATRPSSLQAGRIPKSPYNVRASLGAAAQSSWRCSSTLRSRWPSCPGRDTGPRRSAWPLGGWRRVSGVRTCWAGSPR